MLVGVAWSVLLENEVFCSASFLWPRQRRCSGEGWRMCGIPMLAWICGLGPFVFCVHHVLQWRMSLPLTLKFKKKCFIEYHDYFKVCFQNYLFCKNLNVIILSARDLFYFFSHQSYFYSLFYGFLIIWAQHYFLVCLQFKIGWKYSGCSACLFRMFLKTYSL